MHDPKGEGNVPQKDAIQPVERVPFDDCNSPSSDPDWKDPTNFGDVVEWINPEDFKEQEEE